MSSTSVEDLVAQAKKEQQLASLVEKAKQEQKSTFGDYANEIVAGFNRPFASIVDAPIGAFNVASRELGSDFRLGGVSQYVAPPVGTYVKDPEKAQIAGLAGEAASLGMGIGAGMRALGDRASRLAAGETLAMTAASEPTLMQRVLGQFKGPAGSGTARDVGYGAVSGAGAEYGRQEYGPVGQVAGSIVPMGLAAALEGGARGFISYLSALGANSSDKAAKILAEAMVREGLSPEDVARSLTDLGEQGMPADVSASFLRLLRAAANELPNVEGSAKNIVFGRQAKQGERIMQGYDEAAGTGATDVNAAINRLDEQMTPVINELYEQALQQPLGLSPELQALFKNNRTFQQALSKAQILMENERALGNQVSNITMIDAVKRSLDDMIETAMRKGNNNLARQMVLLKNKMVAEADASIPVYAEARNTYAGKAALQKAAALGEDWFKLKASEIPELIQPFTQQEMGMFQLGVKQAIIDRIENSQSTKDLTSLFGKNGDIAKLTELLGDNAPQFIAGLENEIRFVMTKRGLVGNSTTIQQLQDLKRMSSQAVAGDIPITQAGVIDRVVMKLLSRDNTAEYQKTIQLVGDLLTRQGMAPDEFAAILARGDADRLRSILAHTPMNEKTNAALSAILGTTASQVTGEE